jgi:signal transduction histidine kinase
MPSEKDNIFYVMLIAGILLAIIIGYFIWSFLRQHRRVVMWQQARIKAEIETLENERKRIAADLHDEIGPMLSAVKLQINHLEPADETEQVVLNKSSGQIDHVIQRFREISFDLLPNTLVRKGLVKGTEEFLHRMQEADRVQIDFKSDNITLAQDKEINVYRIIQEIVHNTIKHARAKILQIELRQKKGYVTLHTKDDGVGFVYEERMQHALGLGLLNLQSRVEVLNGKLTLETGQGLGTTYLIEIPV